jgi:hypothetical protein
MAPQFIDDPVANRKPQAGPLPRRFGREKGIEDFAQIFLADAAPRVGHDDLHLTVIGQTRGQCDGAIFLNGVGRIVEKIQDHLPQQRGIAHDRRQVHLKAPDNMDTMLFCLPFHQLGHILDQSVDVDTLQKCFYLRKIEQAMGDFLAALHLPGDLPQRIREIIDLLEISQFIALQKVDPPFGFLADDCQGIIDFMSDSRRELANGGELLRLDQLFIEEAFLLVGFSHLAQQLPGAKEGNQCRKQAGGKVPGTLCKAQEQCRQNNQNGRCIGLQRVERQFGFTGHGAGASSTSAIFQNTVISRPGNGTRVVVVIHRINRVSLRGCAFFRRLAGFFPAIHRGRRVS